MNEVVSNNRMAISISREHILNKLNNSVDELFCFDRINHIESIQISLLVRRDYDLLMQVNRDIQHFSQSGLITNWMRNSRMIRKQSFFYQEFIKFDIFIVAIYLLIVPGAFLGLLTISIEYLISNKKWIFKYGKLQKLAEIFYDGKSYFNMKKGEHLFKKDDMGSPRM